MSGDKDNKDPQVSDSTLFAIMAAIFLGVAWKNTKATVNYILAKYSLTLGITFYGVITLVVLIGLCFLLNKLRDKQKVKAVTSADEKSAFLGFSVKEKEPISLKEEFRRGHTQVIGTTSAGKTESVIFPLAIKDIENGSGLLIIDGKADESFLDKLYSYTCKNERENGFRLFSLAYPDKSWSFNPLATGSHQEIVERAFSIFTFENEYYKNIQFKIFSNLVELILNAKETPSFYLVRNLLNTPDEIRARLHHAKSMTLKKDLESFLELSKDKREERISGIDAQMAPFTTGDFALLFASESNSFTLVEAMEKNQIVYFQLPTMLSQHLGEKVGKMVLQCLQSAVARRQLGLNKKDKKRFFGCYLDDFQDYIYEGFGSLLNKSRSANVAMTFSHQAMGDLDKVSPSFRNIVFTNTNIKVVMRNNDPDTCDLFAKSFGTKTIEKMTERKEKNILGSKNMGVGSVREAEQYIFHPNLIKNQPRGLGILSIAYPDGVKTMQVKFKMRPDLPSCQLPLIEKALPQQSTTHSNPIIIQQKTKKMTV